MGSPNLFRGFLVTCTVPGWSYGNKERNVNPCWVAGRLVCFFNFLFESLLPFGPLRETIRTRTWATAKQIREKQDSCPTHVPDSTSQHLSHFWYQASPHRGSSRSSWILEKDSCCLLTVCVLRLWGIQSEPDGVKLSLRTHSKVIPIRFWLFLFSWDEANISVA